ncbi:MAG: YajQ family cyclic di-GMP-binding protein [Gammaproteobacteria bacterium]|nr:YajQ family cyclic di-GMP-binding protein [Gammaproteobacteria bacterium]MDH3468711.1 YajQ family cyclic di-GMP-binding protein [Gammaproteobacteria bacterium]
MPSFDVVSEVDWHEVSNAIDQANREISNRYDFKGSDARVERADAKLTIYADDDYKIGQARDILQIKIAKRGIDLGCLEAAEPVEAAGGTARQEITVRHGIAADLAKRLVKDIKSAKLKVQTAIQGDRLRISGKKRDDLQQVIALLKHADAGIPLQYINFRD